MLWFFSSVKLRSKATVLDSDEEPILPTKSKNRSTVVYTDDEKPEQLFRKRKSISQIDEGDDEENSPPRKKITVSSTKTIKETSRKKQSKKDQNFEMGESSFEEDEFIDEEEEDVKTQVKRKLPPKKRRVEPAKGNDEPKPKMVPKPEYVPYHTDDTPLTLFQLGCNQAIQACSATHFWF